MMKVIFWLLVWLSAVLSIQAQTANLRGRVAPTPFLNSPQFGKLTSVQGGENAGRWRADARLHGHVLVPGRRKAI